MVFPGRDLRNICWGNTFGNKPSLMCRSFSSRLFFWVATHRVDLYTWKILEAYNGDVMCLNRKIKLLEHTKKIQISK